MQYLLCEHTLLFIHYLHLRLCFLCAESLTQMAYEKEGRARTRSAPRGSAAMQPEMRNVPAEGSRVRCDSAGAESASQAPCKPVVSLTVTLAGVENESSTDDPAPASASPSPSPVFPLEQSLASADGLPVHFETASDSESDQRLVIESVSTFRLRG